MISGQWPVTRKVPPAADRLAQQGGEAMLEFASGANISQYLIGHCRQRERFIEFAVRQQAAVTTDG